MLSGSSDSILIPAQLPKPFQKRILIVSLDYDGCLTEESLF